MIDFSIIIPHFNVPELLEGLLVTIPCDRDDVEVIVVDDRSDRELRLLADVRKRFEERGVKFFRNNKGKKGPGACRNIGLRHATGKWVIFADSDDIFKKDFYDVISGYADSKADMVFFVPDSIREDTGEPSDRHTGVEEKITAYLKDPCRRNELLLRYDTAAPWSKMIRKSMIDENHIRFPDIMVSEDAVFCCKCGYFAKKIEAAGKVFYTVTERNGSLMDGRDEQRFRTQTLVFAQMCRYIKARVSRKDWELLGFNGNLKMIEAARDYGPGYVIYCFVVFCSNGIKPVSFKGMSLRTAPGTLKKILS